MGGDFLQILDDRQVLRAGGLALAAGDAVAGLPKMVVRFS